MTHEDKHRSENGKPSRVEPPKKFVGLHAHDGFS